MSWYTAQPGSGGGGGSGLGTVGIDGFPGNVLIVANSPITEFIEDPTITITIPMASAVSGGYLSAADYALFEAGIIPEHAVERLSIGGGREYYVAATDTDNNRGLALEAALTAQQSGDHFTVGIGRYNDLNNTGFVLYHCSIEGRGMYSTTLVNLGSTSASYALTLYNSEASNLGLLSSTTSQRLI